VHYQTHECQYKKSFNFVEEIYALPPKLLRKPSSPFALAAFLSFSRCCHWSDVRRTLHWS